jgi:N6-L-threonylcarbamoyladenine synthase
VLGIETSCDETAAAVVDPRREGQGPGATVLGEVIASQVALHAPHGGVVPELASRQHLRDIGPVVTEALRRAGLPLHELAGLAVTVGPGLVGSLLVGVSYAKSLALGLRAAGRPMPLVGVHHLEGHVRAAFLETPEPAGDYLALVVSGGHTFLLRVSQDGPRRTYRELARTLDDAAGEAFDKVGKLLGLGYPAGPIIDRLARGFAGEPVRFPRARIKLDGGRRITRRAFSFSGIKTSVRHHVQGSGVRPLAAGEDPASRPDVLPVLAGFQETVVDMLVDPTFRVLEEEGLSHVVAVGGVAANSRLRERLREGCARRGVELLLPSPRWSTDNAAMIAAAGALHLRAGRRAGLDLGVDPSLPLESAA